jgi:hypothetical protein
MIAESFMIIVPFSIQGMMILIDEFLFHRKRGLPRWERIGHPIDTFLQFICLAIPLFLDFNRRNLTLYTIVAIASTFLITKDENVHAVHCGWQEHWLHAILFIVHPVVLIAAAYLWAHPAVYDWFFPLLKIQVLLMAFFGIYQITYWNIYGAKT